MGASRSQGGLYGLRVLVVEDETLIAIMLEDMLEEFGCVIAGVAGSVSQAMERVETDGSIDAAILDVNLGGEKIYPVADALVKRDVPFVFSTAFGPADLAERYPQSQTLAKPYEAEALAGVLEKCCLRGPHHHQRPW